MSNDFPETETHNHESSDDLMNFEQESVIPPVATKSKTRKPRNKPMPKPKNTNANGGSVINKLLLGFIILALIAIVVLCVLIYMYKLDEVLMLLQPLIDMVGGSSDVVVDTSTAGVVEDVPEISEDIFQ